MIKTGTVKAKSLKNDPIFMYVGKGMLLNPFHHKIFFKNTSIKT